MSRPLFLLVGAFSVAALASPARAQSERPTCGTVIGAVNRYISAAGGKPANPRAVARDLKTEPGWVRRCMQAYGRMPAYRGEADDDQRDNLEHAFEEGRDVEVTAETTDQLWERKRQLRIEQKEQQERRKQLQKQREFYESADPFFKMQEY